MGGGGIKLDNKNVVKNSRTSKKEPYRGGGGGKYS